MRRKNIRKAMAIGSLLAKRCPPKICIAQRAKPLITIRQKENNTSVEEQKNLPRKVIKYFAVLAVVFVGNVSVDVNIRLYIGRTSRSSEFNEEFSVD